MHARKNYRAGTNPDILAYDNRARGDIPPSVGFEPVIFRNKLNLRRDESIIAYGDSAPVHKCAAEIDEYALAHAYIPPEIRIERRIQIKIFAHSLPCDFAEIFTRSRRIADRGIHFLRQPLCVCNDFF